MSRPPLTALRADRPTVFAKPHRDLDDGLARTFEPVRIFDDKGLSMSDAIDDSFKLHPAWLRWILFGY